MSEMNYLYQALAYHNAELESLMDSIGEQASATLNLKALLIKKKIAATEKQIHHAMMDVVEQKAEEAAKANPSPVITNLQEHVAKLKETVAKDVVLSKLVTVATSDDLGADIIPLDEKLSYIDENAVANDYPDEVEDSDFNEDDIADEIAIKEDGSKAKQHESFALNITLNAEQLMGKELAMQGKSFCFIGPAGTGKTTGQRAVAEALLQDNKLSVTQFKTYDEDGKRKYVSAPSIAFCAFTRRAAANLRKAVHKSPLLKEKLQHNIMTVHMLLEYEPETYDDYNEEGELVQKFRFAPQRTAANPLNITHLVLEESSMIDAAVLWKNLYEALPPGVQIIFIGDINQLPPVFGPSILNYALTQLPIIELKQVYRNQGIILENAHRILKGQPLLENQDFVIVRGKSPVQVGQEKLAHTLGHLFNQWLDITGSDGLPEYDPEDCMILSPWNKQPVGTDNLNSWIAQHLGARRNAIVHEVIAGFKKLYLAVGDKVMYQKMDGVITQINRNAQYHGKEPQFPGTDLTRFGVRILGEQGKDDLDELALDYSNFSLDQLENEKAERKQQASHTVTVQLENGDTEVLSATGDFNDQSFSLGYVLTVHKAQGSEWRKVFIILHKDHAVSLYRELFYTAETRARTKVTLIAKDAVIEKAIKNQRIKGNSTADKIEYFNSGVMDSMKEPVYATK